MKPLYWLFLIFLALLTGWMLLSLGGNEEAVPPADPTVQGQAEEPDPGGRLDDTVQPAPADNPKVDLIESATANFRPEREDDLVTDWNRERVRLNHCRQVEADGGKTRSLAYFRDAGATPAQVNAYAALSNSCDRLPGNPSDLLENSNRDLDDPQIGDLELSLRLVEVARLEGTESATQLAQSLLGSSDPHAFRNALEFLADPSSGWNPPTPLNLPNSRQYEEALSAAAVLGGCVLGQDCGPNSDAGLHMCIRFAEACGSGLPQFMHEYTLTGYQWLAIENLLEELMSGRLGETP